MLRRLIVIVAEVLGDRELVSKLSAESDLLADAGLDSIEMTELMLRIEDEFGVELDYERLELHHFRKLSRLEEFLNESRGKEP